MKIMNRLFTYPVLNEFDNGYNDCVFNVEFGNEMIGIDTLRLKFNIGNTSQSLLQLIHDGKAEYLFHLENSSTAFRIAKKSIATREQIDIPISKLNGTLETVVFVVAKEDLNDYYSEEFDPAYEGTSFNISKGSILAYQNLNDLEIEKDPEDFRTFNSIFVIKKILSDVDLPLNIKLEGDKIIIELSSSVYDNYIKCNGLLANKFLLNSLVILPTLIYVIEELRQEDGVEMYEKYKWFKSLEYSFSKRGIDLRDELNGVEKNSLQLAQEMMELPLGKAINQLDTLCEQEGD